MAPSFKRNRHSEEAFLLANFSEFVKCWSSGKKSRLVIESVNGHAIVNFTAFLGHPSADHFHFNSKPKNRQPKPRQKSERKIQRDNARAASFQERKRKEKALNPSPSTEGGKSIVDSPETSSPSSVQASPELFQFSDPLRECLRGASDISEQSNLQLSELEEEKELRDTESSSFSQNNSELLVSSDNALSRIEESIDPHSEEDDDGIYYTIHSSTAGFLSSLTTEQLDQYYEDAILIGDDHDMIQIMTARLLCGFSLI